MNSLLIDLWPYILTATVPSVGIYIGYIHQMRIKIAVMEKALEAIQQNLDNMQKRVDNHSKKQDEILNAISQLKVEIVKAFSDQEKHINSITNDQAIIATEVKNINHTLSTIEK